MNLTTNYMGIELINPIIIGANNLVTSDYNLAKMEEMGAGAIVYKSLFEEQLHMENLFIGKAIDEYSDQHPEITNPIFDMEYNGPKEYMYKLKKARKVLKKTPLFASINAVYDESWIDFALKIAKTGVDGIELNFYTIPKGMNSIGIDTVNIQLEILKKIKGIVDIPIAVKLSPYYTNTLEVVRKMDIIGADAFVLFNRFFQADIDLEKEEIFFPYNFSSSGDYKLAMRYAGLLYKEIEADVCSGNGIYTGHDTAKLLLAGADTVQVVSTIYKNGIKQIKNIIEELEGWMKSKSYESINDFRGKLSKKSTSNEFAYERAQYLDILMNTSEIEKHWHINDKNNGK